MKKVLSIILILLLVAALAACGTQTATTPSAAASASASAKPSATASAAPSASAAASASAAPSASAAASASAKPSASAPATADDDWAYIKAKGTLVIGYTDYEPMNFTDKSGKLVGFDTEYAEAICKKLGLTAKFVLINWDTKEVELKSKNIDCIWNGLTVTEERKANMAFTSSYIRNEQVLVVKAADVSKYADKASLKGKSLVAETESAGASAIQKDLKDAKFKAVDSQAKALLEVKAGTADGAVIDATMAKSMTGPGTDYADLAVITKLSLTSEEYAIGLRVKSTAVEKFNQATADLIKDGTMKKIADTYKLADRLITK